MKTLHRWIKLVFCLFIKKKSSPFFQLKNFNHYVESTFNYFISKFINEFILDDLSFKLKILKIIMAKNLIIIIVVQKKTKKNMVFI